MTVVNEEGEKIMLPRVGPEHFWKMIQEHYAGDNAIRWKALAILALRENAGWPQETIGQVFGHPRGHVSRILAKVKQELRETFACSPEWLCLDDPEEAATPAESLPRRISDKGFSNPG